jgi:hypothetical protein
LTYIDDITIIGFYYSPLSINDFLHLGVHAGVPWPPDTGFLDLTGLAFDEAWPLLRVLSDIFS